MRILDIKLTYCCQSNTLSCLASKDVTSFTTSAAEFPGFELPFNLRLKYTPAIIILPNNEQDVANSVCCAHENGLKVQARGGGHSYASFSTGGQNGSFIVDLSNFSNVEVYGVSNVKFGGGVRLGNLDLALLSQGERVMSHGTCAG
jgi:FAD/FMN-containing dehydrogenase